MRKYKLVAVLLTALLCLSMIAAALAAEAATYTLSGVVRGPSGEPVPGAVVVVDAKQGIAGVDGRYVVGGLAAGVKALSVYLSAQEQQAGTAILSGPFQLTGNTTKDFSLPASLSGTVRDAATGAPIAGASVTVARKTITTKADGSYSLSGLTELPNQHPGPNTFVSKDGYTTLQEAVTLSLKGVHDFRLVAKVGDYELSGVVRGPSGEPVPGAVVVVDAKQGIAGVDGRYVVGGLAAGVKALSVYLSAQEQQAGTAILSGPFQLTGNTTKDFSLPASLSGTVRDAATGAPIAGASVTVARKTTTTKADGSYSLSGLTELPNQHPGPNTFVSKDGYTTLQEAVTLSLKGVRDFRLVAKVGDYELSGVVRGPSGEPVPGAVVVVDTMQGTAGADGRYVVKGLAGGLKTLSVYLSEREQRAGTAVLSGPFQLTGNTTKDFSLPASLSGTVRDAATGAPIAGANVTVARKTTTTKADGSYSLSGLTELPNQRFGPRAHVSKQGYKTLEEDIVLSLKGIRDFRLASQE